MKLSMKLQDLHSQNTNNNDAKFQTIKPVLLRAKVPVTVFGFPFLSSVAGTDKSDVSLSLSTNFSSGPSLKLSYSPNYVATPDVTGAAVSPSPPLTVTLKSGIGLFGSPRDSSLMISAHFSVDPGNPNPNPTFSLQIKPQFGNFSLHKTTHSSIPKPVNKCSKGNGDNSFEFVPLASPFPWKEFAMESPYKECLLSGMAVTARTELPLMKRLSMSFRWGVNFTEDIKKQLPYLTVNKVSLQRVDLVDQTKVKSDNEDRTSDLTAMKDLFLSTRKELEVLQSHNREMVWILDEMKTASSPQGRQWTKSATPIRESYGEPEQLQQQLRKSSGGDENNGGKKEGKKNMNQQ